MLSAYLRRAAGVVGVAVFLSFFCFFFCDAGVFLGDFFFFCAGVLGAACDDPAACDAASQSQHG